MLQADGFTPHVDAWTNAWHRDVVLEEPADLTSRTRMVQDAVAGLKGDGSKTANKTLWADALLFYGEWTRHADNNTWSKVRSKRLYEPINHGGARRNLAQTNLDLPLGYDGSVTRGTTLDKWNTGIIGLSLSRGPGGAGNDVIRGGDGVDILIGQRGDDEIHGGGGNDFILGDCATAAPPFSTGLPLVINTYRVRTIAPECEITASNDLFETKEIARSKQRTTTGVEAEVRRPGSHLPDLGMSLYAPMEIAPEHVAPLNVGDRTVLSRANPVLSAQTARLLSRIGAVELRDTSAPLTKAALRVAMSMRPPSLLRHGAALGGNDKLYGDEGDDLIVGDSLRTTYMDPFTDRKEGHAAITVADTVLASLAHRFAIMSGDGAHLDNLKAPAAAQPFYVKAGNDVIDGGAGCDMLIGDELLLQSPRVGVRSFHETIQNAMEEQILDYLWDIAELATDADHTMYQAHHNLLDEMRQQIWPKNVLRVSVPNHGIDLGNDVLTHGSGSGNYMVGDTAMFVFDAINYTSPYELEANGRVCKDGPSNPPVHPTHGMISQFSCHPLCHRTKYR